MAPFDLEPFVHRLAQALHDGEPVGPHGVLRERSDRFGKGDSTLECGPFVDQSRDQSQPQGLLGANRAAGEDHVHGPTANPTMRGRRWVPPSTRGTPYRRSRQPNTDVRARHPEVAPERHLQAAGYAEALHRGDGRLADPGSREPEEPSRAIDQIEALEVCTGREMATLAVENPHIGVVVFFEPPPRVGEALRRGAIDGIPALLAVDGHHRRAPDQFVPDGHGPPCDNRMPHRGGPYHPSVIWSIPVGSMTLYAIEDGWFHADPSVMFPGSDQTAWTPHTDEEGMLRVSLGCFAVVDGSRVCVIDTGMGELPSEGGRSGQMPQALALIGIRPEDVTNVVYTHLHRDHVGGSLTHGGEPFFPNAVHWVQAAELDHWMSAAGEAGERARAMIEPLVDAGMVSPLEGNAPLVSGVSAVSTPGHTPGHQSILLSSAGSEAYIAGDVAHHPVQAGHSDWGVAADLDAEAARLSRESLFERLAGSGSLLAGGHFPRPGLGYVEEWSGKRVFVAGTAIQVA